MDARNECIMELLPRVYGYARSYARGRNMTTTDYAHEAVLGLIKAWERYDPSKGAAFATYAHYWVHQSMQRALVKKEFTIRIPENVLQALKQADYAEPESYTWGGKIGSALQCLSPHSLDSSFSPEEGMHSFLPCAECARFSRAEKRVDAALLGRMIDRLPRKEAYLLRRYYGLGGQKRVSSSTCARELGVSRQTVVFHLNRARERLRKMIRERELQRRVTREK
jgi:RNA polymerase sigma factor (sigma-70 family)